MTASDAAGSLEKLLDDGWGYHAEASERLARELEAAAEQGVAADLVAPFLHLATHTIGEHLGDWARALRLGRRVLDRRTPTAETARAWGRLSVVAMLAGEAVEAAVLELSCLLVSGDDLGPALLDMRFMLAAALVGAQRTGEAALLYRGALDLVGRIPSSPGLDRSVAVASNNLGWALYEMASRRADEDALMQLCAATGLAFWRKCGNWINEEQALYLTALVSNAVGRAESALAEADQALAVIAAQGARPLDAALLHLVRASSLAALGDRAGRQRAIAAADAAASALTAPGLQARFAAERAKIAELG